MVFTTCIFCSVLHLSANFYENIHIYLLLLFSFAFLCMDSAVCFDLAKHFGKKPSFLNSISGTLKQSTNIHSARTPYVLIEKKKTNHSRLLHHPTSIYPHGQGRVASWGSERSSQARLGGQARSLLQPGAVSRFHSRPVPISLPPSRGACPAITLAPHPLAIL